MSLYQDETPRQRISRQNLQRHTRLWGNLGYRPVEAWLSPAVESIRMELPCALRTRTIRKDCLGCMPWLEIVVVG